ncbi:uncharacterized protein LOC125707712 isoform X2 [Brienomyrus brachyistius]|uniref:uncharacterized protein LOC125707712 isoform X2 n=1 Tax=Brienomyrus brachyistius TaxID=42636 RepID=UPI0020B1CF3D|nr:uncharacterized protein LOC125707712 isoform X2 [Brienomyrus brachyistius]
MLIAVERRGSQEEEQESNTSSHWIIEPPEELQGSVGRRRITQLPPLRQEVPLTLSPLPTGSVPGCHSSKVGHSIIQSHPPRRTQALQPMMSSAARIPPEGTNEKDKEWRGGAAHRGRYGTGSHSQGEVLEAQVVFGRQVCSQRRAHRRRAQELREQRKAARVVVTGDANTGLDGSLNRPAQLVKRHAERDIFWDGESLDFQYLSESSLEPPAQREAKTHSADLWTFFGDEGEGSREPGKGSAACSLGEVVDPRDAGGTWSPEANQQENQHPPKEAREKSVPWMLEWKVSEGWGLNSKDVSGNRHSTGIGTRPRLEASTQQVDESIWARNSCLPARENRELETGVGVTLRQQGRLNRTRAEVIPSFKDPLDFDI